MRIWIRSFVLFVLLLLTAASTPGAQPTSLADSIARKVIAEKVLEKVEEHHGYIEQIKILFPGAFAITLGGMLYFGWAYFRGLSKKLNELVDSPDVKQKIALHIREQLDARDQIIKGKPICIIYPAGSEDMRTLPKLLSDKGFTQVAVKTTTEEAADIVPNTLLLFYDKTGHFAQSIGDYLRQHPNLKAKGRFFYYGSARFQDPEIMMHNFANTEDTLLARLFESLNAA